MRRRYIIKDGKLTEVSKNYPNDPLEIAPLQDPSEEEMLFQKCLEAAERGVLRRYRKAKED